DRERGGVAREGTRRTGWSELPLTVSFRRDRRIPPPKGKRDAKKTPADDDLEGVWASAQAAAFAVLEAQTSAFGFYGFARHATGRKYGVAAPALVRRARAGPGSGYQRPHDTTTRAQAPA